MDNELKYVEPSNYFPKEVLKEFGLGEFAEEAPKDKNDKEKRELDEKLENSANKRE